VSLDVSRELLAQAEQGPIDDDAFVACVRDSLPWAYDLISGLAGRLRAERGPFADNTTPPPNEQARGQLLRVLASDAMRGALERHLGVRLAFQNCHRVAVFDPPQAGGTAWQEFVSPGAQVRNQRPALRDC
jgi:hypothetical protein